MSERDKIRQEQKIPKVGIPSGAICNVLLYDLFWTKGALDKAKEENRKPTPLDGLGCRMAIIDYFVGNEQKICIDYSDIKNIQFPCDIADVLGNITYAPIGAMEYLNIFRLTQTRGRGKAFGGYVTPTNDKNALYLYDLSFQTQFGSKDMLIPELYCKLNLGGFKADDFEELKGKVFEGYPILSVYRYIDMDYPKGTWTKSGKDWIMKEGAIKNQPVIFYTTWNRTAQKADLVGISKTYLNEETTVAIMEALRIRQKEKDTEKTPF